MNDYWRVYAQQSRGILPRLFSVAPQRDSRKPQAASSSCPRNALTCRLKLEACSCPTVFFEERDS